VFATLPATAAFAGSATHRAGLRLGTASSAKAAVAMPPRSRLTGLVCHRALQPAARAMYVRALMRPITGTLRMEMRFELLSKSSTAPRAVNLHGGGLGTWISPPNPTLGQRSGDVWIVPHPVYNLPAPAVYHYRVSFRWIGSDGRILSTRTRRSNHCFQPELRPDLLVSSITIQQIPGKPAKEQYVAAIENQGLSAAGPFDVTFTPGASNAPGSPAPVAKTKALQYLGPGATRDVSFEGPICTTLLTPPAVVVDPNHTVDEYDYDNNALTVAATCPLLTSAAPPAP